MKKINVLLVSLIATPFLINCACSNSEEPTPKSTYTIIWQNDDGAELEKDIGVPHGTMPTYDGETPVKPNPEQGCAYTFNGWTPAVKKATGDAIYTATYTKDTAYTVTWKDWDGTVLEIDKNVKEGSTPSFDGDMPIRPIAGTTCYSFKGWDNVLAPVFGDATYTAEYDPEDVSSYAAYMKVNTSEPNEQFSFSSSGSSDYTVDWGDGSSGQLYYHTYKIPGEYNVKISNITHIEAVDTHREQIREVYFGNGITEIKDHAFKECPKLNSVKISDHISNIGNSAFEYCEALKYANIPSALTATPEKLYYQCKALTDIIFPNNLVTIGNYSFSGTGLISPILHNTVKTIEGSAFSGCESLESIDISHVETIKSYAFAHCSSLGNVTFSDSITEIGDSAFTECPSITSIDIPDSVTSIRNHAFAGTSITEIVVPDSVINIGVGAFSGCALLQDVTLPTNPNFTTIHSYLFAHCSSLETVKIPNNVTSFEWDVFEEAPGKPSNFAFLDLTEFTDQTNVPTADDNLFRGAPGAVKIVVASDTMRAAFANKGGGWPANISKYIVKQ